MRTVQQLRGICMHATHYHIACMGQILKVDVLERRTNKLYTSCSHKSAVPSSLPGTVLSVFACQAVDPSWLKTRPWVSPRSMVFTWLGRMSMINGTRPPRTSIIAGADPL